MKNYKRYKGNRPRKTARKWLVGLLAIILICVLVFTGLLGCVLTGDRDRVSGDPQIMIILGCQVMPSGRPSMLLQDRLEEALNYLESHPDMTVMVSGSMAGTEPITEASCMAEYLIANGVPEENIIQEDESHNTWQNLQFCAELLSELGYDTTVDMVVVSNGFHLTRARMLWGRLWGTMITCPPWQPRPAICRPGCICMSESRWLC